MPACHLEPEDKKAFIGAVGKELTEKHGKKKYYRPAEVRSAAERLGYAVDIHCWAYCIFLSHDDFKTLHDAAGEACDYAAMKASVLQEFAPNGVFSWLDIDLSWLEWPDIDPSSLFDWFDLSP
jgi:hypothetical protein